MTATAIHNNLGGLDGGDANGYYHLTQTEKTSLSNIEVEATSGEVLKAGQPVYVNMGDGLVYKATASTEAASRVCGFCRADAANAAACTIVFNGGLESSNWTQVTGSVNLTPGAIYYLDTTAGQLTVNAPTVGYSLQTATAISATELTINLQKRILL